ncbi:MAG: 2-hydroxyacid dehydrogenase [Spartobacteria bacterium]|nr:2-hydroxyacid dehydrogenase [Spartobacteria bacterium]
MQRISFFDTKPYDERFFSKVNESFGFDIRFYQPRLSVDTALMVHDSRIVCAFVNDNLDNDVLRVLYDRGVRMIAMRCAGYNNVDLLAAYGKVTVCRVPAYSPYSVAEHAVALAMSLNRKTHKAYYRTRDNNFNINGLMGFDFHGKTVGVIGTGKIGTLFLQIMKGFGMDALAYDPYPDEERAKDVGFTHVSLDELYARSDILSLHCPLTPENVHMINAESLEKMKESAILINTGRGKLIHTQALVEALKQGQIAAAGLDVYEEEDQYFFEDFSNTIVQDDVLARLLSLPNVLVTSHQAFFTREAMNSIALTTLQNIRSYIDGTDSPNEICSHCKDHPAKCMNRKMTSSDFKEKKGMHSIVQKKI